MPGRVLMPPASLNSNDRRTADTHFCLQSIQKGEDGLITFLQGKLNLEGSVKSTKWKLTWLPTIPDLIPLQLVDFGYLITKKKIEEDDIFEDHVNPDSVRMALHWHENGGKCNIAWASMQVRQGLSRRFVHIPKTPLRTQVHVYVHIIHAAACSLRCSFQALKSYAGISP